MSRAEDSIIGRIDRQNAKAQTSARTLQVRADAVEAVNAFVMALPEEDRATGMREAARHLRSLYGAGHGEKAAVEVFGALGFSKELNVRAVVAKAEAERIAQTLFRNPANENSGGEG